MSSRAGTPSRKHKETRQAMWTDPNGRDWSTAINVQTVRCVRDKTEVLLTDAADTDLIERLYTDVMLLADVLYAVSIDQAEAREMSASDFGEMLAGETIDKACESFMEDLILFFPSGRRQIAKKIWTTASRLETEKTNLLTVKLTDEQLDKMIAATVDRASKEIDKHLAALGDDSGKSPES